jgi:hypothetical protein
MQPWSSGCNAHKFERGDRFRADPRRNEALDVLIVSGLIPLTIRLRSGS